MPPSVTAPFVALSATATADAEPSTAEVRFGGGSRLTLSGDGRAPSPVEALLASLAACQVLTYRYWAARRGIALEHCEAKVEGRLDPRGFGGEPDASAVGVEQLRVVVRIGGPEPAERYVTLADDVDRHCPVHDTLSAGVHVERVLDLVAGPTD